MSCKYDYLIIGAGLFGSVFANCAIKKGKTCLVLEKRAHIGGNIYTETVNGINVHRYGAHIFHTSDKLVWDFINGFCTMNSFVNSPIANYKGNIYHLPFNMNTFYEMWGVCSAEQAKAIIQKQIAELDIVTPSNLEEQALKLVGRDIYEKLIRGYTEKQWGRPCKELPAFLIKRLPLRFTYDNNYFNDVYQGIPVGGYTAIISKLLEGSQVLCNVNYQADSMEFTGIADKIVYTGCIDEYFGYCLGGLDYRSLRFETFTVNSPDYQGNAVVNYTDSETPYTRVIEHKHFEGISSDVTVISREYPEEYSIGKEPFYPINDDKNNSLYARYLSLASMHPSVIFGGRLGMYSYLDMDKTVKSALALAEREGL